MKIKTKNKTYEIVDIKEHTSKVFFAYWNGYTISLNTI